jgi:NADH-quinone oxidoreductase subunit G
MFNDIKGEEKERSKLLMPHVVIDGKTYEAQAGKTIIQVAYENGVDIPHFCWHPELSVSGNCRMCLVEVGLPKRMPDGSFETDSDGKTKINFFPKLQIACATQITDGMHVRTKTENVKQTQEAVMEFILINHPLDCPICDEAGQCKLQDYAFTNSRGESRFTDIKNRANKRQSWGPNVLYDAERCITCSRCIRFAKEVAKQDVLTFVNRGDRVTIKLFDDTQFDNPYSMNVIDICPVGALTSKDFRFKARVWDMAFNDSICPGCSRGCNIKVGTRNNEILRIEPKANPYVNKFWMCDYGRLTQYEKYNLNRVNEPMIKSNGKQEPVSWNDALKEAATRLSKFKGDEIMIIGSAYATNEDDFVLSAFAKKVLKTDNLDFQTWKDDIFKDDFLKTNDRMPNAAGAEFFGIMPTKYSVSLKDLADKINIGTIKAVYSLDDDFEQYPELITAFDSLELFILHANNHSELTEKADILLAASSFFESEGTWINIDGRVQHFEPVLVTTDNQKNMGMKLGRLDKFGHHNDRWHQHDKRNTKPDWKIIQQIANKMKVSWKYKSSEEVFNEITGKYDSLKGFSYALLDEYQGLKIGKATSPDPKIPVYKSHKLKPN